MSKQIKMLGILMIVILAGASCNLISTGKNTPTIDFKKPKYSDDPVIKQVPAEFEKFKPQKPGKFDLKYATYSASINPSRAQIEDDPIWKTWEDERVELLTLKYNYSDGRYDKYRIDWSPDHEDYAAAIWIEMFKFTSVKKAEAYFKTMVSGDTISEAEADKKRPKDCKSDNDPWWNNQRDEVVKKIPNRNGKEILVLHSAKFYDSKTCELTTTREEMIRWTDGAYFFEVVSKPYRLERYRDKNATGFDRAQEFLPDYLQAVGQQ